jgi:hypothetical protein
MPKRKAVDSSTKLIEMVKKKFTLRKTRAGLALKRAE